jgi:hypothetical protein
MIEKRFNKIISSVGYILFLFIGCLIILLTCVVGISYLLPYYYRVSSFWTTTIAIILFGIFYANIFFEISEFIYSRFNVFKILVSFHNLLVSKLFYLVRISSLFIGIGLISYFLIDGIFIYYNDKLFRTSLNLPLIFALSLPIPFAIFSNIRYSK